MRAIEVENEIYLSTIKKDLTDVKTYLPSSLSRGSTMRAVGNSLTGQFNNKGFKLGLMLPILLNNTLFKSKSKATKTLISSIALVLDDNLSYKDIKKNLKKLFSTKKKKKKNKKNKISVVVPVENPILSEPNIVEKEID